MADCGHALIQHYLSKYTTIASIEAHAYKVQSIEESMYRRVKRIYIDSNSDTHFIFKTLTPASVPRQIENEAAAIKYVRARTGKIPTPRVLAYSTAEGDAWIALESVAGARLSDVWPTYSEDTKWQVLHALVDLYKLLAAITSLDAFGATQIGGLNLDLSIGETVEPAKSQGRQNVRNYNPGPYKNVEEYVSSYVDKEIQYYRTSPEIDMRLFDYNETSSSVVDDDDDKDENADKYSTAPSSYGQRSVCEPDTTLEDGFETIEYESDKHIFSSYVHIPSMQEELQRRKNRDDFILYLQDLRRFVTKHVDTKELACLTHNQYHAQNIIVNKDQEIIALYHWEFAGFYPLSLTFEAPRMDFDDDRIVSGSPKDDERDWSEAFVDLFGRVKDIHPLVAAVLEPMNPLVANAWEDCDA